MTIPVWVAIVSWVHLFLFTTLGGWLVYLLTTLFRPAEAQASPEARASGEAQASGEAKKTDTRWWGVRITAAVALFFILFTVVLVFVVHPSLYMALLDDERHTSDEAWKVCSEARSKIAEELQQLRHAHRQQMQKTAALLAHQLLPEDVLTDTYEGLQHSATEIMEQIQRRVHDALAGAPFSVIVTETATPTPLLLDREV